MRRPGPWKSAWRPRSSRCGRPRPGAASTTTGVWLSRASRAATPLRRYSTRYASGTLTSSALAAQLQARAVHQQVQGLAANVHTGVARPRHLQRRGSPTQRRVARHAQAEAEQAGNGADQPLGLPVGQAEHRADRERRQDGERRIPGLPTAARACLGRPRRDRLVGEPHRQAAALTQAGVVGRPIRHLALLPWEWRRQSWFSLKGKMGIRSLGG